MAKSEEKKQKQIEWEYSDEETCSRCGMTQEEFKKNGTLCDLKIDGGRHTFQIEKKSSGIPKQPSTKEEKKVHTSVLGVSDKGVTVFKDGKHPRTLRAKAQE